MERGPRFYGFIHLIRCEDKKNWRGPTSEKCKRNSVGGHFEIGRSRNRQSGKIVISSVL